MATIVNARDVILQAYSPRVATVSVAPNLVVSQSQVTGLGLVVAGTKMVFLNATTQVFQIAKSGAVSPSSTVLTADLKNVTSTPTLTVVSGTISPVPTLVSGSVTIPYVNMSTDTAMIRLTVVQDGITYTDEVTLVKVREGIDGLIGFLSNEAHMVAADYLGNVLAYTGASGNFKVFQGVNDITSLCSFSIPAGGNTSALTATINATTGAYSVSGGYPTTTDVATLLLRATFGSVTIDKVFTISKSKAGAPGTNGATGTNGLRGSRTYYVTLTGTTATYSDSLATTTASADGGPVLNDVVTQYNTSQGFSQTRFYTAGGWVIVNAVVDGNLIVSGTIGATQMQTNLLNADNVLTRGLTVRDTSGNIILSSGVPLSFGRIAGTTGGKIDSANITTFISGAAIGNAQIADLDAQKLTAGSVTTDKLNVGLGNNLLDNSGFAHGTSYWALASGGFDVSAVMATNLATTWTLAGSNTLYIYQPNNFYAGNAGVFQYAYSKPVPVSAGTRYEFSAYTGAHGCTVTVQIAFRNSAGTDLVYFSASTDNAQAQLGGIALDSYKRLTGFCTAPAGATSAVLLVLKTATAPGSAESYMFAACPLVAAATVNQTTPSPWSLGGTGTRITSAGIETNSIKTINLEVGSASASTAGFVNAQTFYPAPADPHYTAYPSETATFVASGLGVPVMVFARIDISAVANLLGIDYFYMSAGIRIDGSGGSSNQDSSFIYVQKIPGSNIGKGHINIMFRTTVMQAGSHTFSVTVNVEPRNSGQPTVSQSFGAESYVQVSANLAILENKV